WLWNAFRKQPLQTPEARQAGMLFRQQRHGLAVPRLLAFGQRRLRPWRTESFLLTEVPPSQPPLLPSPLLRGRGVGDKGPFSVGQAPSPPTPLPRVQGTGEKEVSARRGSHER